MKQPKMKSIFLLVIGFAATTGCAQSSFWRSDSKNIASSKESSPSFTKELSLARLQERHGKSDRSKEIYRAVLKKDPQNQTAQHRLGVIAAKQSDFETAHQHFQAAAKSAPPTAELLNDIGYTFYLQDRLEEAEGSLRQALALDSQHQGARNNLGLVLGEKGQSTESLAEFRKVVTEAEALANLAYVNVQKGDVSTAKTLYNRSLDLDGDLRPAAEALVQLSQHETRLSQHKARLASRQAPVKAPVARPVTHTEPIFVEKVERYAETPESGQYDTTPNQPSELSTASQEQPSDFSSQEYLQQGGNSTENFNSGSPIEHSITDQDESMIPLDDHGEFQSHVTETSPRSFMRPVIRPITLKQTSSHLPPNTEDDSEPPLDDNVESPAHYSSEINQSPKTNTESSKYSQFFKVKPASQKTNRGDDKPSSIGKQPTDGALLYPNRLRSNSSLRPSKSDDDSLNNGLRASLPASAANDHLPAWQRATWQPDYSR